VFPQECGDFQMLFDDLRSGLPAMLIELPTSPFLRRGSVRNPWSSGLYGAACRSIVGGGVLGLVMGWLLLIAQVQANIGGETLEQRAGVARLGFLTILRV
jgi:hypothetical protein